MSDIEYNSGVMDMLIFFTVVMTIMMIFVVIPQVEYLQGPVYQEHLNEYHKLTNQTRSILSSKDVTCLQIQDLREESLYANNWWEKPISSSLDSNLMGEARDLWNVKNCGTHWGWFEP